MTYRIQSALTFVATVVALSIGSKAVKADEWDKETRVTFSGSVEVNRTTLPAGTYIFRLIDTPASRNLVQVFREDRQHLVTAFVARSTIRRTAIESANVTLDYGNGNIPVVTKWFYPLANEGREFPQAK